MTYARMLCFGIPLISSTMYKGTNIAESLDMSVEYTYILLYNICTNLKQ